MNVVCWVSASGTSGVAQANPGTADPLSRIPSLSRTTRSSRCLTVNAGRDLSSASYRMLPYLLLHAAFRLFEAIVEAVQVLVELLKRCVGHHPTSGAFVGAGNITNST